MVDADAQGPTGIDMVLADDAGRPILVDIVLDAPTEIPTRVFDHLEWLEQTRRLFLRAYSRDGVVKTEEPVLVFMAEVFSPAVMKAVSCCPDAEIRLIKVEHFVIDGIGEVCCEEVSRARDAAPEPGRGAENERDRRRLRVRLRRQDRVRRRPRALRALQVRHRRPRRQHLHQGLERRHLFELGQRPLAVVSTSPGSFTVSLGDPVANPIVVSDRVSLERALNAVVSSFVREGEGAGSDDGNGHATSLDDGTTAELARIWGGGVGRSERG